MNCINDVTGGGKPFVIASVVDVVNASFIANVEVDVYAAVSVTNFSSFEMRARCLLAHSYTMRTLQIHV